ncbi:DUF3667 domain-containing protein [Sphingomonas sp. LY160]|uniref:DUF3667 domain-containing protein n=1 Tax=Sphingomonas sp. LY160 TaxID=3095342 RepID=UPI002ADED141|nr:DUF3667 domain-containing protein [Sphingomonas sp. LY160]MEA1072086.1 DUF3667 domain-containing protein [Sphingomonas sp. LY160]
MSDIEGISDVITGAAVARAVEPSTGGVGAEGHTHESACLNCGTILVGDHCHACGQHAHVHRTLSAFFHDLLHGVFHFEGKVWRTLPMLAWRPGELTRAYIDGKRASFVSPIALFLFSVFLMFALLGMMGTIAIPPEDVVRTNLTENVAKDEAKLAQLQASLERARAAGQPVAGIEKSIASVQEDLGLERAMAKDGVMSGAAFRASDDMPPWLKVPVEKAAKNPELLLYKVKTSAYKWSWAVIPLSVPLLWLLFPFSRRFRLYDHTVFVTYSLGFMMLLACLASLLIAVGLSAVAGLLFFIPPFHIYKQLRGTYGLTRFGAIWRAIVLVVGAITVLSLFGVALFGVGMFD